MDVHAGDLMRHRARAVWRSMVIDVVYLRVLGKNNTPSNFRAIFRIVCSPGCLLVISTFVH